MESPFNTLASTAGLVHITWTLESEPVAPWLLPSISPSTLFDFTLSGLGSPVPPAKGALLPHTPSRPVRSILINKIDMLLPLLPLASIVEFILACLEKCDTLYLCTSADICLMSRPDNAFLYTRIMHACAAGASLDIRSMSMGKSSGCDGDMCVWSAREGSMRLQYKVREAGVVHYFAKGYGADVL